MQFYYKHKERHHFDPVTQQFEGYYIGMCREICTVKAKTLDELKVKFRNCTARSMEPHEYDDSITFNYEESQGYVEKEIL